MEIWKDIKNYEGRYQISNFGNVKSLERIVKHSRLGEQKINERLLSIHLDKTGYLKVSLCKNNKQKRGTIHQLVAESFLGHEPNGHTLVVNHIDFNKQNNHVSNLEIVTVRRNSNRKHLKSSSKYTGVSWDKGKEKWISRITINNNVIYLGQFDCETKAHLAYQNKLKTL